ncbi:hypothetical protein IW261DRAFT_1429963 [Armillaria novae-zelandiae]|uniref:Histone deacetylase domain-containing protein n=1 Tax=Armillaria novae-zelandiae TaxID=153914 RepID=A0AA39KE54_9AGAR|nr:hypothetical protein IW261DRAFT_1429963 [Armillaria novae-zelandiae]
MSKPIFHKIDEPQYDLPTGKNVSHVIPPSVPSIDSNPERHTVMAIEEAFYTTDHVMTCSFHKYGEYFPGTGTREDKGRGKGKGYAAAVNVPLKDGITDESFQSIFKPYLREKNVPLILLSGGGYTVENIARTWTYETACALGIEDTIDPNLPLNGSVLITAWRINALEHLRELNSAPSVGMHDVPNESLLEHLGFGKESDTQDKLDERLAQHSQFRVVYKLQESDTSSDDESWDSNKSIGQRRPRRCRKQRMSLLTGQHFDVAHNHQ